MADRRHPVRQQRPTGNRKSHCSAFIATGDATADGRIVIGHESFTEFWNGQYMNFILDITPDDGYRMVIRAVPAGSPA